MGKKRSHSLRDEPQYDEQTALEPSPNSLQDSKGIFQKVHGKLTIHLAPVFANNMLQGTKEYLNSLVMK
jgi:hypothetical protein